MTLFSQRMGINPLSKAIQRESIDLDLRNKLWSAIKLCFFDNYSIPHRYSGPDQDSQMVIGVMQKLWLFVLKQPLDTLPEIHSAVSKSAYEIVRKRFFEYEWWEAYDLIEFLIKNLPQDWGTEFASLTNGFLEMENAAYRIVGAEVVEITDKHEIDAIESALEVKIQSCRTHLARALELLSDRKQPDFRNSIKESISSVEGTVQLILGQSKGTLGDCLRKVKGKIELHPALEQAFSKLYGYTSDKGGIRHALSEESNNPSYADAKFMLVSCAAFVNYLLTKSAEVGLKFGK
jgi:hypothetical protein